MLKKSVKHIHKFRIILFFFIVFSFLYTVGVSPIDYTKYLGARFSSAVGIGSTASVPANPMNTLALQLKEKESKLDTREMQLDKRELDLKSESSILQNKIIWGMIVGISILFILILLNFFLDWHRKKTRYMEHETDKF